MGSSVFAKRSAFRKRAESNRSVTNMSISRATEHLAKLLKDHFLRVDPKNPAIRFLEEVARIGEFRYIGNLDAWESAVLNVYTDNEWVKSSNVMTLT